MFPELKCCEFCRECWNEYLLTDEIQTEIENRIDHFMKLTDYVNLCGVPKEEEFTDFYAKKSREIRCLLRWKKAVSFNKNSHIKV